MATGIPQGSAAAAQQAAQENFMIRQRVVGESVDLTQLMASAQTITNYTAGQATVLNFKLNNVGLVKRLWVKITATVGDNAAGTGQTLTPFGPANALSQVILTDTSNTVRVQTTGWHLHYLASARRRTAFGAAYATSDPSGVGGNLGLMRAVNLPAAGSDTTFNWYYEIPVSYSDTDLTGAIWMNIVNATANLQLTINPNFFVAAGAADPTGAVYQANAGGALGVITTMTVTVYQNCLDQLPTDGKGNYLLPSLDLQYALLVQNTSLSGFTVNLDQQIPFANFRQFMSTFVLFDNGGTLSPGTDVNYIAMQSANMTQFFKVDPFMNGILVRNMIGDDFPPGLYYIDTRNQPVNTVQYGNRSIVINPSTVNANANFQVGYESIGPLGVVNNAGSLFQS